MVVKTLNGFFKNLITIRSIGQLGTLLYVNTNLMGKKLTFKKKNFMAPFYGWGPTASRLQPLRGGSLLFTIQFPEISGTHFIDLGMMKG